MLRLLLPVIVVVAAPRIAGADIDNVQADRLFAEAVALRDSNPAEACMKFEQALGFNPQAIGTRLNVALCDERLGRIASAVEKFSEVADRARVQKLAEYLRVAEERLAVLVPDVPFLAIRLAEQAPQTTVLVDDRVIAADKLAKLAVDPGERVLVVTAPGRVAFRRVILVPKRATVPIEVPPLAHSVTSSRRSIGKITVVAGGATAATGIVIGLVALRRYRTALEDCDDNKVCSAEAASDAESARTLGSVSTVVTCVGVGAALVGGYLWWRSPRSGESSQAGVSVLPHVGTDGAGVVVVGRF